MSNVYEIITDRITKQLEAGTVPWQKPWIGGSAQNLVSKKEYRGINPFLLACAGYASPYWVSYKQAQDLGGTVKKGEKGFPVVFWKWLDKKDPDAQEGEISSRDKRVPMLRYYTVFNAEAQCEGVKTPATETRTFVPIHACATVVCGYKNGPTIDHAEPRAYYRPGTDSINMPKPELFRSPEEYYSTIFHEMTHSTGHANRLNRSTLTDMCPFGSTNYSKEELVAEMGAAFLCGHAGIENKTIDNSAAYLASWLKQLRKDPKLVILAAAQAQKASDHILGKTFSEE